MFGDRCEKLAQYLVKGTKVICEGSLQLGSYESKDGTKKYTTDIFINNVEFTGDKKEENHENYNTNEVTEVYDDGTVPF